MKTFQTAWLGYCKRWTSLLSKIETLGKVYGTICMIRVMFPSSWRHFEGWAGRRIYLMDDHIQNNCWI